MYVLSVKQRKMSWRMELDPVKYFLGFSIVSPKIFWKLWKNTCILRWPYFLCFGEREALKGLWVTSDRYLKLKHLETKKACLGLIFFTYDNSWLQKLEISRNGQRKLDWRLFLPTCHEIELSTPKKKKNKWRNFRISTT